MPEQLIDPELIPVACHLANCQPEELLAVAQRGDELIVVVHPGPKHVFSAQQVADAVKELHAPKPKPAAAEQHPHQAAPEPAHFARVRDYTDAPAPLEPEEPKGKPKPKRT